LAFGDPHPPTRGPYDLYRRAQHLFGPVLALTVVAGIELQMRKAREPVPDELHERLYAVVVEDVRRVDLRFEHQPLRVHRQVTLSSPSPSCPGRSRAPRRQCRWSSRSGCRRCRRWATAPSRGAPAPSCVEPRAAAPKYRRCARGRNSGRRFSTVGGHEEASAKCSRHTRRRRRHRGSRGRGGPAGVPELSERGRWGSIKAHSASERSVWYALLIMPGILSGYLPHNPFSEGFLQRVAVV
jgi:hypothetical protein